MQTEIEAKWIGIDKDLLRKKLRDSGAKLIYPERLMARKNYDFADMRLNSIGGWVRVRNEGGKTTLSYKQVNDRTLHGTKEVCVIVDDFDSTCKLLESIGLAMKSFQETKRESWVLNGCEVEIDTWPWIPSFVEIEGGSEDVVYETAKILELEPENALHGSVEPVYQAVYDVAEAEINSWKEIRFIDTPDWLLAKKLR